MVTARFACIGSTPLQQKAAWWLRAHRAGGALWFGIWTIACAGGIAPPVEAASSVLNGPTCRMAEELDKKGPLRGDKAETTVVQLAEELSSKAGVHAEVLQEGCKLADSVKRFFERHYSKNNRGMRLPKDDPTWGRLKEELQEQVDSFDTFISRHTKLMWVRQYMPYDRVLEHVVGKHFKPEFGFSHGIDGFSRLSLAFAAAEEIRDNKRNIDPEDVRAQNESINTKLTIMEDRMSQMMERLARLEGRQGGDADDATSTTFSTATGN